MFANAAFSFLTLTILATSGARFSFVNSITGCDTEQERNMAELVRHTAINLLGDGADSDDFIYSAQRGALRLTPFASCSPRKRALPLEHIANEDGPLTLCGIGKLAKGGSFFTSEDGSFLVKRVSKPEAQELAQWGRHAMAGMSDYPGDCEGFRTTLLVETILSFKVDGSTYIVMPNLTYSLAMASPENWVVEAVYDAKPLPNLGEGLVQLFKDVSSGWGVDLPTLDEWLGWDQVHASMVRDMTFLAMRVVDFSIFVHVLRRKSEDDRIPDILGPSNGCIVEPGRSLLVCFRVLDYLTPFSWVRRIESRYKDEKFHDYTGKFLKAFNCLGNVDQPLCKKYKALASISEAMDVSTNMAKAVFIGSTAFREAYTCTHETPSLQHSRHWGTDRAIYGDATALGEAGLAAEMPLTKRVEWIVDASKSSDWLQAIASPAVAYSIGEKFEVNLEVAYSMSEVRGHSAHRMPKGYLESCVQTVKDFATESYAKNRSNTDMLNVLWEDGSEHIIAVRGLPKAYYEHKARVEIGRLRNCFLKTHYMRCEPETRGGVYFNYKQHFGTLEIMVMSAREHSDDMNVYSKAFQSRKEITDEILVPDRSSK